MSILPMFGRIPSGKLVVSFLFLPLAIFLLASCGNSSSTTSGSSSTSTTSAAATATVCAQTRFSFKTATGTLSSIQGSTFVVTTSKGNNITVTYSSTTRFTREDSVPATSLKEGTFVTVAVTSTGSTYTATRITVTTGNGSGRFPGFTGTPGAGRANNPCLNRGQFGTPGTGQPRGSGTGTSNFRGLIGTVSQVTNNTMTITDTSGSTFSVTITPQTQVMESTSVTSGALKTGEPLTVSGSPGSNGVIDARSVTILLKLPTSAQTQ